MKLESANLKSESVMKLKNKMGLYVSIQELHLVPNLKQFTESTWKKASMIKQLDALTEEQEIELERIQRLEKDNE